MTRILLAFSLALAGCTGVPMPPTDGGQTGDASLDARYVGCQDVALAYDSARARLGCSYDWPNCPVTISGSECIVAFGDAADCSQLDSVASRCSL